MKMLILISLLISSCGKIINIEHDHFFDKYLNIIEKKIHEITDQDVSLTTPVRFSLPKSPTTVGVCYFENWLSNSFIIINPRHYSQLPDDQKEDFLLYILVHESLGHCHNNSIDHRYDIVGFRGTESLVYLSDQVNTRQHTILRYPAMPGSIMWPNQMDYTQVSQRLDWYISEIYNAGYNKDVATRMTIQPEEAADLHNKYIYDVFDKNDQKIFTTNQEQELLYFLSK